MKYTWDKFGMMTALLILGGTQSSARQLRGWTFDELHKASDVVVVARFVAWREIEWDFDEEPWQRLFDGEHGDFFRKHIVARDAVFHIDAVIQGSVSTKSVRALLCDYSSCNHVPQ